MSKFFRNIIDHWKLWRAGRKRLSELKKRDPFIY